MTDSAPALPLPGLLRRVVGVISTPRNTFERVVPVPRIFGMLTLVTFLFAIGSSAFTFTAAGQQAAIDFSAQQIERFTGQPPNDAQMARIEKQAPIQSYLTFGGTVVFTPILIAIEAGILFVVFNVIAGGTASYRQVYAVATHASVIGLLGLAVTVPMQFIRGAISMTGPANLGALFPMLPENSTLSSFLGLIDLFRVWWLLTLAIGLGVLYRRPTRGIALTLLGVYLVIILSVAFYVHGR